MKIAILGWGSLIWDPRSLKIDATTGKNGWNDDGPMLPIEFTRISNDGRLTLVIKHGVPEIQVLFAISKYQTLDEAILDLALREGCLKDKIGYSTMPKPFEFNTNLNDWLLFKTDIDTVIWTNLSPNFQDKLDLKLTPLNVVNYLKYIPKEIQIQAEEYIRKAPAVVDTPIRSAIEVELGWKIIHLTK